MDEIQKIYIALFGRPADPLGLAYFDEETNGGADLTAIGDLSATDEYQTRFEGLSNAQIINSIYNTLYNRDADAAGLAYFAAELTSGRQSINTIAINIAQGAQGADLTTLNNKVTAANAFTAAIDTGAEIAGYSGTGAAEQGRIYLQGVTSDTATIPTAEATEAAVSDAVAAGAQTGAEFALTPGQDFADTSVAFRNGPVNPIESDFRFTASDERVTASSVTLSVGDLLTDSSTTDNDRLNVTVSGNTLGNISGAVVTNIETINLTLTSATGNFDLTNYTGVKTLDVDGSVVTTAGNDQIVISGFANSGVTSIDVSGATTTTNLQDFVVVQDAAADQAITFKGHAGSDFVVFGDGDNTVDLGAGSNVANLGDGDNTVTGGALGDQIVVGNGNNTINAGDGPNVVVAGTGTNTITTGTGVDSVSVGTGNNTIVTGAGNDTITTAAGGGSNTITAGAGADVINLGSTGADKLILAAADTGLGTAADTVTGFQTTVDTLDFTDLPAGTVANYAETGAVAADYAAALVVANNAFAGSLGALTYFFVEDGTGVGNLFVDSNNDGVADNLVKFAGLTDADFEFGDIV